MDINTKDSKKFCGLTYCFLNLFHPRDLHSTNMSPLWRRQEGTDKKKEYESPVLVPRGPEASLASVDSGRYFVSSF